MANLTGYAGIFPGGTSAVFTTPFPISVGTKAQDTSGNEYVFCSFGGAVSKGEWVVIDDVNDATALTDTSVGRVGVVVGTTPTSNDGGWVQIYGLNIIAQTHEVSDAVSPHLSYLRAVTYATTPAGTVGVVLGVSQESVIIHNAWPTGLTPAAAGVAGASDASWPSTYTTASSSPVGGQHSGLVLGVFLNYPFIEGQNKAWLDGFTSV